MYEVVYKERIVGEAALGEGVVGLETLVAYQWAVQHWGRKDVRGAHKFVDTREVIARPYLKHQAQYFVLQLLPCC